MDSQSNSTPMPTVSIGTDALSIQSIKGEPRIEDTDLGRKLGFPEPRAIRRLIKRHAASIDKLGPRVTVTRVINGGEAEVWYLNRKQAIFITAKSETDKATEVTIEIVKRFDEYEGGGRNVVTAEDLIRNPEHLLAITQGYALQIADLRKDMTAMQEDVDTLHRLTGSDDLFGVRATAKLVQMPQNRFVEWLKRNRWAYRQIGTNSLLAYAEKEKAGMCRNVATPYEKQDGSQGIRETLKFFPKGIAAIARKLNITITEAEMAAVQSEVK
jgi:phage antirepressor YoqD-like protein